jgi:excisionase family DNA binding protein
MPREKKLYELPPADAVLFTIEQAAKLLGLSENGVRLLVGRGELESVKAPGRRLRRFRRSEVERIKQLREQWRADTETPLRQREAAELARLTGGRS